MRKEEKCLEKVIVQGTTPGSRAQGRPKVIWLDNTKAWTELSVAQLIRNVENRQKWRKTVHDAANPRIEDG